MHLTLVPSVSDGELKTKPTQHSVKALREIGIQPDILLCRAAVPLPESLKRKISLFTNVEDEAVISAYDVPHHHLRDPADLRRPEARRDHRAQAGPPEQARATWPPGAGPSRPTCGAKSVRIGLVGKYMELLDSYKSSIEALYHGGIANGGAHRAGQDRLRPAAAPTSRRSVLGQVDGFLVPGGFGQRGIEGMIAAARYARLNQIPYFGICLGMQMMVIEYARGVLGLAEANSTEFEPETPHPVISLLEEQLDVKTLGGTMRLGASETQLVPGTQDPRDLRRGGDPGAPPPPLRGVQPLPAAASRRPAWSWAPSPWTAAWWKRRSGRTIPGASACSSTRSSAPSRSPRTPCSPRFVAACAGGR